MRSWPIAGEDFDGGAGHVDVVVGLAPFDLQVTAGQVRRDLSAPAPGQYAGDAHRAGACAAGLRCAAATLPGKYGNVAFAIDFDEVDVGALGEQRIVLDA